jgi:hypothetical protein
MLTEPGVGRAAQRRRAQAFGDGAGCRSQGQNQMVQAPVIEQICSSNSLISGNFAPKLDYSALEASRRRADFRATRACGPKDPSKTTGNRRAGGREFLPPDQGLR